MKKSIADPSQELKLLYFSRKSLYMDAEQMFIQFEERALSGELIRTSNGGNHVLAYFNNAEKINNGRCKRWIVHFIKNDELVAS
ncbi:MAG: hypothetical protein AAFN93_24235, partial [Bacteroidota bacterium]